MQNTYLAKYRGVSATYIVPLAVTAPKRCSEAQVVLGALSGWTEPWVVRNQVHGR